MNKTKSERLNRTAAFASANLEELHQIMADSPLRREIRKLVDRIDKEFSVVSLSIPVE